jgi:hypothetical protein
MIWRRGITLMTNITKHWRKEDIERLKNIRTNSIYWCYYFCHISII